MRGKNLNLVDLLNLWIMNSKYRTNSSDTHMNIHTSLTIIKALLDNLLIS